MASLSAAAHDQGGQQHILTPAAHLIQLPLTPPRTFTINFMSNKFRRAPAHAPAPQQRILDNADG